MIRFLADADLNDAIVSGCVRRESAIDFLSANAANLQGVRDPEVLALAAGRFGLRRVGEPDRKNSAAVTVGCPRHAARGHAVQLRAGAGINRNTVHLAELAQATQTVAWA